MPEREEYALEDLFKRLPISVSELARRSQISEGTAASIRNGKQARLHSINKLLKVFSELYQKEYTIDNVRGLQIMTGRYGDPHNDQARARSGAELAN